ncbi:hypothetical protein [Streptomyces sp. HB132]|uniref:hypothetical protein n=1 Tax=Streptomyces sp. HB132 TaxID=767388 RepID=UPI0019613722|nr:hypothetical protein [Streptomyces sp. HB132]MBM7440521.1 hypothetical protein [Streptomyces sp. HB132]
MSRQPVITVARRRHLVRRPDDHAAQARRWLIGADALQGVSAAAPALSAPACSPRQPCPS